MPTTGEYGDPWDVALGVNWFPMKRRELRVNVQGLYMDESPVGYASVPFIVGGDGWLFTTDVMLNFWSGVRAAPPEPPFGNA